MTGPPDRYDRRGEDAEVNDSRLMIQNDLRQYKGKQVDQVDMVGAEVVARPSN